MTPLVLTCHIRPKQVIPDQFHLENYKSVTKGAIDMAGMILPIISSAVRSPWFKATRDLTTAYGDHEGRLTPVTFERPIAEEYQGVAHQGRYFRCARGSD